MSNEMVSFFKRFFGTSQKTPEKYAGKIEVFSRHCLFSSISQHKKRFPHFSREACYQNLIETLDLNEANLTLFLDIAKGKRESHFLHTETRFPLIEVEEGSESGSFLKMLEYISHLELHPDTILYFVEDDYLHLPNWTHILKEAFTLPGIEYATLYDHKDKYFFPEYKKLTSQIFVTPSTHWRTTPSTTQTFAVRFKTLLKDLSIHRKYSPKGTITKDHEKFCHLRRRGEILVSSIPGYATHAEPEYASPLNDWEALLLTV